MSPIEEIESLNRRARAFLEYANEALKRGDHDLACFFSEQAVQLRTKSLLLRILGYMPKGHRVRELLGFLIRALEELNRAERAHAIKRFILDFRNELRLLEDAYVASRYMERSYDADDAERTADVATRILKLLDEVEVEIFATKG